MADPIKLDYRPNPKQALLHNTPVKQIFYGGAAGGGKSYAMRWDATMFCLNNPGMEAFLFRRTYTMLEDNHIRPIQRDIPPEVGVFVQSKGHFVFKNGSRIVFCHCEHTNDYLNYMGAEFHWLGIDEASLMEPIQIIELRGRVRLGNFADKIVDKNFLPRVVMTSNPGGPSHSLLKRTIVSKAPPMTVFYDTTMKDPDDPEDKGWTTIFIPATMEDNPQLDKGYGSVFSAMAPERARALKEGDWDAIEGAALHSLSKARHMVKQFKIPPHWTRFMAMDWGTAKPFSIGWYAVASEDVIVNNNQHLPRTDRNPGRGIFIPRESVIRYSEYYGWTGEEDTGVRLDSATVARNIVAREKDRNELPMDYRVADSAMWNQYDGPSPAEKMASATTGLVTLVRSRKDRVSNYNEMLGRLAGNPFLFQNGVIEDHPLLFITENCLQAWRTLPSLISDKTDPDKGPDTRQEDHIYDELAYALASRPMVTTEQERQQEDYEEYKRAIKESRGSDASDPYGT